MSVQPPSTSTSSTPVPGAALPSTTKPKRNRKKAAAKSDAVPLVEEVSASPSEPVQPKDEGVSAVLAINGERKEKGPVEEVIAKRMRQLTKKLQRFRGYASQSQDSLNADQKAAVSSLPTMESIYKELEDLLKQVEPVELEQAGKIREMKEQARKEAEGSVAGKMTDLQTSLSSPLALFLRLHRLLHPARPSDHEHLTFARLDLPSNLQDEVQATDVLRVGRMYDDLLAGGERGSEVIAGLVRGSTGDDEENDHIHHLLSLLATPDSQPADNGAVEEVDLEESQPAPEVEEPVSKAPSVNGLVNGVAGEEDDTPAPTSVNGSTTAGQGALNFLQEDELAEEEFEIVPSLRADQTSGSQPPQEPVTTIPQPPIDTEPAPSAPAPFTASSNFDWAADEDLDEATEAAHIRQAFALPPSGSQTPAQQTEPQGQVEEATVPTEDEEPAIALIQENELANAHVFESAVDAPTAVESDAVPAPPAVEPKDIPVQGKGNRGQGTNRGRGGRNPSGRNQGQSQGPKTPVKPTIDEDGFQVVGRQAPPQSNRGRGNFNGRSRGDGGRGRGQGQGQNGRGRGGLGPRNTPRPNGDATPQTQQGGNRPPKQQRQASQAQPHQSSKTPSTPTTTA
ncbi:hypothetical protein I302_101838 [Kwoniella bestiolae CBS 10118]|uniref:Uncharacterized protein n=1 Tax=Kwoniella bestiolae CBS 10118 TaxID=1296100 RepID=A0A1B9GDD4_9TREE|nr:hypothetical protein I302_00516 [Kwoniella bestiolae CBS 10118]OCF29025.1 hypothetical protein I302_00516 [Kwoniella bestiolae CBS 10118]